MSIDRDDAEARYGLEPAHEETPERLYERRWALSLLDRALERLGRECETSGRAAQFEAVRPILAGSPDGAPYAEIAASLGTTEGALKTAIHRLRQRYGELLRAEIAETVGSPSLVDDELHALLASLA